MRGDRVCWVFVLVFSACGGGARNMYISNTDDAAGPADNGDMAAPMPDNADLLMPASPDLTPGPPDLTDTCFVADNTGCSQNNASGELSSCHKASDCLCPYACVSVGKGSLCERPCCTTDDCPTATTVCTTAGACETNYCDTDNQGNMVPGTFAGPCDAAGMGDGTCLSHANSQTGIDYGVCAQAGTAKGSCQVNATRAMLDKRCPVGQVCIGGAQALCEMACDRNTTKTCKNGLPCTSYASLYFSYSNYGICCKPAGLACAQNADCCGAQCKNGSCCAPNGMACQTSSDCCTGTCPNGGGFCQ